MTREENNVDGEERPSNDGTGCNGWAAGRGGCLGTLAHRARISHTRSLMSSLPGIGHGPRLSMSLVAKRDYIASSLAPVNQNARRLSSCSCRTSAHRIHTAHQSRTNGCTRRNANRQPPRDGIRAEQGTRRRSLRGTDPAPCDHVRGDAAKLLEEIWIAKRHHDRALASSDQRVHEVRELLRRV